MLRLILRAAARSVECWAGCAGLGSLIYIRKWRHPLIPQVRPPKVRIPTGQVASGGTRNGLLLCVASRLRRTSGLSLTNSPFLSTQL